MYKTAVKRKFINLSKKEFFSHTLFKYEHRKKAYPIFPRRYSHQVHNVSLNEILKKNNHLYVNKININLLVSVSY